MNKIFIGVVSVSVLLSACSSVPKKSEVRQGDAAPIVDIRASGASGADNMPTPTPVTTTPSVSPSGGGYLTGDGPGADTPSHLDSIPDAVPQAEPLHKYANRPYSALGKTYTPLQATGNYKERGIASWYGKKFHGQKTSIGEIYDMYAMTAAHPTLPIPSYARVTNVATGKSVIVRVNDRGPFLHGRIMDLSYVAAYKLGYINNGSTEVEVESIKVDANTPVVGAVETPMVQVTPIPQAVAATPAMPVEIAGAATGKIYLQLGAFKAQQGAESFMTRISELSGDSGKSLALYQKSGLTRVHLGPYPNKEAARAAAAKLQSKLGFKPFVSVH
ncbi:MAG: septal ring lytic transglycosylase RlpA family protein [Sideroxydans sp.]|nr:septal ring lytic transglycosylase RlpA family protein [Sideroxydans sp.]